MKGMALAGATVLKAGSGSVPGAITTGWRVSQRTALASLISDVDAHGPEAPHRVHSGYWDSRAPESTHSGGEPLPTKRPSYLKRQKEQQRLARANSKREARRERKRARDEMNAAHEPEETDLTAPEAAEATEPPDQTELG
jgi:hypothetical protein